MWRLVDNGLTPQHAKGILMTDFIAGTITSYKKDTTKINMTTLISNKSPCQSNLQLLITEMDDAVSLIDT